MLTERKQQPIDTIILDGPVYYTDYDDWSEITLVGQHMTLREMFDVVECGEDNDAYANDAFRAHKLSAEEVEQALFSQLGEDEECEMERGKRDIVEQIFKVHDVYMIQWAPKNGSGKWEDFEEVGHFLAQREED